MIAIVPARAGSKGVPDKNFRSFAGSSLAQISINHAAQIVGEQNVFFSSDYARSDVLAKELGVNHIRRPKSLSNDNSKAEAVLSHAVSTIDRRFRTIDQNELILYLQPTSPLRDVRRIIKILKEHDIDRGFFFARDAVDTAFKQFIFDEQGRAKSLFYDHKLVSENRQNLQKTYIATGEIFAFLREDITGCSFPLFGKKVFISETSNWDIDTLEDFLAAEQEYLRR